MRQKHVPQRTCIGCMQTKPKRELVRVVRTPDGHIEIDPTGKKPGRGAYLCRRAECWEKALSKGALTRALQVAPSEEEKARLRDQMKLLQLEEELASSEGPKG
jgi:predicted RNA-binding protein YlxR (DUF448 family)